MSYTITGNTLESKMKRLAKEYRAKDVANVVRKSLILRSEEYNWKRFKKTIKQATIDSDTEMVFINDQFNAKQIAGFLDGGTKAHFIAPRNKKALHWGGKPGFFSKGHMVRGIKAFHWWGLTVGVKQSIKEYGDRIMNKIFNG